MVLDGLQFVFRLIVFYCVFSRISTDDPALSATEGPSFVLEPPEDLDFSNSHGAKLECRGYGVPQPTVTWTTLDGNAAANISELRTSFPDGTLVFSPFRSDQFRPDVHTVGYRCVISNSVGTAVSRETQVKAVLAVDYDVHVYDSFVTLGNTAVFTCHIPTFLEKYVSVIAWIRDDSLKIIATPETDGKFWLSPVGNLYIKDIAISDKGSSYHCQTRHRLSGKRKTSVSSGKLIVTEPHSSIPPKIGESASTISVSEGKVVFLPCVATGYPTPTIKWTYRTDSGDKNLPFHPRYRVMSFGLLINDAQESDAGVYTCQVSSSSWTPSKEITLNVLVPLQVSVEPKMTTINVGKPLTLGCHVVGQPLSSIAWIKSGNVVPSSDFDISGGISKLSIPSVKEEDRGVYQCFASNGKHVVHGVAHVLLGDFAPEIVEYFHESVTDVGALVNLSCKATGNPSPHVKWFLDTVEVEGSPRTVLENELSSRGSVVGSLRITSARRKDGGVYTCEASNHVGKARHSARVSIHGSLAAKEIPPVTVVAGEDMIISCPVYGYPIASVDWAKESLSLPATVRQKVFVNGTLLVKSVQRSADSGEYICTAKNTKGEVVQSKIQLNVMALPKIIPFAFQDDQNFKGMRAHIICAVSEGDLPIVFRWLKDGGPLAGLTDVAVSGHDRYSSSLSIDSVSARHSGNYTCIAANTAGEASFTAQLLVQVGPKIQPFAFHDEHFSVGGNIAAVCMLTEGDPPIFFSWKKDGSPADSHPGVKIVSVRDFSSMLTVVNATASHAGRYSCTASNSAASDVFTAELRVNVAPKIVPFSFGGSHYFAGVLARVTCVVYQGDLPLVIDWLKDGEPLLSQAGVSIVTLDDFTSVLTIDSIAVHHSGNYTCVAGNAAAAASHTAQLVVKVPPHWLHVPKQQIAAILNEDLALHCEAEGFPHPKITWAKGEEDKLNGGSVKVYPNGTLTISRVQEAHEGYYVCKASNGIGADLDRIVHLKVHDPPLIIDTSAIQMARDGDTASLNCVIKGDTPLNVTWLMDGKVIGSNGNRYKTKEIVAVEGLTTELIINKVKKDDGSVYVCMASNAFGRNQQNITLVVQSHPDPPSDLMVSDIHNQSVLVSWKAPFDGNNYILKYILEYRKTKDPSTKKSLIVGRERHSFVVSNLKPSASYTFRAFSENGIGQSVASDPVEVTIAGEVPSGAPQNVNVQALDSKRVKVSWQPPSKDMWNGDIRGYYVGYRHASSADAFNFQLLEVPAGYDKGLSFTIPDLEEFTKYAIVIQAFNDIGKGPQSREILVMTNEDVPSRPPSDVRCSAQASNQIAVSWIPPTPDTVNGILRGHRVLYWPVDSWDGKRFGVANSTESTATLNDLHPFTNYSIQVVSYTFAGDGIPSRPVYCTTWEDVPGSPDDVKCVSASAESLVVFWSPPSDSNGHITHYTVYMEEPTNGKQTSYKVPGHTFHFEVQGLKRSLRYKLWVTASSILGEGRASQPVFGGPAASFVAAKSVTSGRTYRLTQGVKVTLPCPAVGIPTPEFIWKHGEKEFVLEDRFHVLPEKSLQITRLQSADAGSYTCQIKNDFGEDAVVHTVIVKTPPLPPTLYVTMATFNSVGLRWKLKSTGDSPILGYVLRFKPEFGLWDSIELQPYQESHTVRNLRCGTTYEMTLAAVNEVGAGDSSDILEVSTDGGAPVEPRMDQLVEASTNHATLHLESWITNGCPILYFTVEYKSRNSDTWILVTKGVKPNQRMQIIPELVPETWYTLRMTAHSAAGTTVVESDFATLSTDKDDFKIEDLKKEITNVFPKLDVTLVAPIAVCILAIVLCAVVTCFWVRHRRNVQEAEVKEHAAAASHGRDPNQMSKPGHRGLSVGPSVLGAADSDEDISPYAMVRLSDFQGGPLKNNFRPSSSGALPQAVVGWHQSQQGMMGMPCAPTAPPMSETYALGGPHAAGLGLCQSYTQPMKGAKKNAGGGSLPTKLPASHGKNAEGPLLPPHVDGDYDPPPEFKWPFPKQ